MTNDDDKGTITSADRQVGEFGWKKTYSYRDNPNRCGQYYIHLDSKVEKEHLLSVSIRTFIYVSCNHSNNYMDTVICVKYLLSFLIFKSGQVTDACWQQPDEAFFFQPFHNFDRVATYF